MSFLIILWHITKSKSAALVAEQFFVVEHFQDKCQQQLIKSEARISFMTLVSGKYFGVCCVWEGIGEGLTITTYKCRFWRQIYNFVTNLGTFEWIFLGYQWVGGENYNHQLWFWGKLLLVSHYAPRAWDVVLCGSPTPTGRNVWNWPFSLINFLFNVGFSAFWRWILRSD